MSGVRPARAAGACRASPLWSVGFSLRTVKEMGMASILSCTGTYRVSGTALGLKPSHGVGTDVRGRGAEELAHLTRHSCAVLPSVAPTTLRGKSDSLAELSRPPTLPCFLPSLMLPVLSQTTLGHRTHTLCLCLEHLPLLSLHLPESFTARLPSFFFFLMLILIYI